jgi:hypothetical protein
MTGWENFFVGELGASSALAGLVFVGISINLTKILASPLLPSRALEALVALLAVLFVSTCSRTAIYCIWHRSATHWTDLLHDPGCPSGKYPAAHETSVSPQFQP